MTRVIVVPVALGGMLVVLFTLEILAAYGRLRRSQVAISTLAVGIAGNWFMAVVLSFPDFSLTALLMAVTGAFSAFAVLVYYLVVRIGSGGKTLRQVWAARDVRTLENLAEWRAAQATRKR